MGDRLGIFFTILEVNCSDVYPVHLGCSIPFISSCDRYLETAKAWV